jgi:hypothetical protein
LVGRKILRVNDIFICAENKITPSDWLGVIRFGVPLVGFEPTTILSVKEGLYPLSYSGTQRKDIFFRYFYMKKNIYCG